MNLDTYNSSAIGLEDLVAIIVYFILVIGVGLWASCRAKTDSAAGYFLAGRSSTWIPIGASTFSTNVGAPMFIGLAGSAAASGVGVIMFEWHAMLMLLLLGWFFLPVYISSGCLTLPQYLKFRFGGQRIRVWIALIHTFITIISAIAGQMYAGALFIQQVFRWNMYACITLILIITALYTIIGGLNAVIWTDTIQTVIMIMGSIFLAAITLKDIGGFESMRNQYMWSAANHTYLDVALHGEESNMSCGLPKKNALHIWRPADDPDYPWTGMVGGLTILALNCWCTDQVSVQRSLSAKNLGHAKAGCVFAAYLKIFSFLLFVIPGMISRVLYPDEVACADPVICKQICGNAGGCTNIAFPLLVIREMPVGIRGIMLAALLAALMSSLTSIFNSSGTLFTMDLWKTWRPKAKERELMVVGRLWTVFLAVVSVLWLPILQEIQGSEFWDYSQAISAFIVPPIVVAFILGILWPRCTEQGVFWGLVTGLAVGLIRMALDWSRPPPNCGSGQQSDQFTVVAKVHFLHFAMIVVCVCLVVMVAVSYMTPPRSPKQLHRVTWWTRHDTEFPELTDNEDSDEEGGGQEEEQPSEQDISLWKGLLLKWLCGVNKLAKKEPKMSREYHLELQRQMTDIKDNPFWGRFINVNGVICGAVCVLLHAFWY